MNELGPVPFLLLAAGLFLAGVVCLILQRNAIITLLGVELIFNAAVVNFITTAAFAPSFEIEGETFALVVAVLALLEAVLGLAIIGNYRAQRGTVDLNAGRELKG
jgi:NADH-quinone oxidoreductase subunit K